MDQVSGERPITIEEEEEDEDAENAEAGKTLHVFPQSSSGTWLMDELVQQTLAMSSLQANSTHIPSLSL